MIQNYVIKIFRIAEIFSKMIDGEIPKFKEKDVIDL